MYETMVLVGASFEQQWYISSYLLYFGFPFEWLQEPNGQSGASNSDKMDIRSNCASGFCAKFSLLPGSYGTSDESSGSSC